MAETIRIAMWSGPRNISTAMMRAWSSRADCRVMDEPFYAAYLATTGIDHPMRDAVIASQPTEWPVVAEECATASGAPIVFQKHMCQHMIPGAPLGWMADCRHAFLIRPPEEVALSYAARRGEVVEEDLGFRRQAELFDHACQISGEAPPVVAAADVLADPGRTLAALTRALGVSWDPAMLSWPRGPHQDDGVWGAHWYRSVNASTGFAPPERHAYQEPPSRLLRVIEACRPFYDRMVGHGVIGRS